ncbi:MAG: hypothetical protein LIR50_04285 [Bacillota bacterium]|nr:hypothetical protein [Bacillota bacterium]
MEELRVVKRTKEMVNAEDLNKIEELTKRMREIKKELIKLMEEKKEINYTFYKLEKDYCDKEYFEDEIVDSYNTLPAFEEATKEYEAIMRDTKDFWLEFIGNESKEVK